MNATELAKLVQRFTSGELGADAFMHAVSPAPSAQLAEATLDLDRGARCGFPEVVYAPGKSLSTLIEIVSRLAERQIPVLVTRVSPEQAAALEQTFPAGNYHAAARTFRWQLNQSAELRGKVAVITAGTSDLPIAAEAQETLAWMQVASVLVTDVGVAGPHRLPQRLKELEGSDAVIVVAGMEGALPSVVGGYLPCPIIGVPTSVGYGANFGGVSALLSMLNSCAANVTVVNIDAGFKAGYVAGLIASRAAANRQGK